MIKQKESLKTELSEVEAKLKSLESGVPASKKPGRRRGRPAGSKKNAVKPAGKRRGKTLKSKLLKIMSAAGTAGITVKDLAVALKVKPANIFSWFYTTGKMVSGIKKVGEAKYSNSLKAS